MSLNLNATPMYLFATNIQLNVVKCAFYPRQNLSVCCTLLFLFLTTCFINHFGGRNYTEQRIAKCLRLHFKREREKDNIIRNKLKNYSMWIAGAPFHFRNDGLWHISCAKCS